MPRLPMDYERTIIYKIVCNDLSIKDCYVGATTNFTKRKSKHKHSCNTETNIGYNLKIYQFIRNNGGWDNWTIVMIEEYPCKSQLESDKRERYWIETLKAELNNNIPNRKRQEWFNIHKEEILKKEKERYLIKKNIKNKVPV